MMMLRLILWRIRAFLRDLRGGAARFLLAGSAAGAVALAIPLIARWEGAELRAYRDIVGVWTICYGETRGVQPGDTATPAECRAALAVAVAEYDAAIRKCLPHQLPDATRAAFVSAAYNIGAGAFCRSSMSRRALAGDLRGACEALMLWNRAGGREVQGLTNRRTAERALCLSGLP